MVQLVCEQIHCCRAEHALRLDPAEGCRIEAPLVLADLVLPREEIRYHAAFGREVEGCYRYAVAQRKRQELAREVVHLLRVIASMFVDVRDRRAVVNQEA